MVVQETGVPEPMYFGDEFERVSVCGHLNAGGGGPDKGDIEGTHTKMVQFQPFWYQLKALPYGIHMVIGPLC